MPVTTQNGELPIITTNLKAAVFDFTADVCIAQTFKNCSDEDAVEADLEFDIPTNSAICELEVTIGDKKISAKIAKKQEAEVRHHFFFFFRFIC